MSIKSSAKRNLGLLALLFCGSGALVYGGLFHTAPVYREKERKVSIPVPSLFRLGGEPGNNAGASADKTTREEPSATDGDDEVDPFLGPSDKPAPRARDVENAAPAAPLTGVAYRMVTEKYWEAVPETEWTIAREMTVGGLTRSADGRLRRTYSGVPPSLCPT